MALIAIKLPDRELAPGSEPGRVTEEAFELVWAPKGWVRVSEAQETPTEGTDGPSPAVDPGAKTAPEPTGSPDVGAQPHAAHRRGRQAQEAQED